MAQSNAFSVTVQTSGGGGGNPAWYSPLANQSWTSLTGGPAPQLSNVNPCPGSGCSYSANEGQPAVIDDWCGAVASESTLLISAQGGHMGYAGNEVYEYDFALDTPRWFRRVDPSTSVQTGVGYYADGKPSSRHGYMNDCFIPPLAGSSNGNRHYLVWAHALYGTGNEHSAAGATYNRTTGAYDAQGFFPDAPGDKHFDGHVGWDPVTERVWKRGGSYPSASWPLHSMDPRTKTWTAHSSTASGFMDGQEAAAMIDPVRRVMVATSGSTIWVTDIGRPNDPGRVYTVSGLSGADPGIAYEPLSGKWVQWAGGKTLRVITPPSNYRTGDGSPSNALNASASYSATSVTPSGGATPSSPNVAGTFGRFRYIANPRGFCVVNSTSQPMYFFKCATAL